jgi:membrane-associated phospholipid phosphatase
MARWSVPETKLDRRIAAEIERWASPSVEEPAKIVTLAADERLLLTLAGAIWLMSRASMSQRKRRQANYLVANVIVTNILSRILKGLFAQKRPDRTMVHGRRRGIPRSGETYGAFPSGHAMYIGAISSVLGRFFPKAAPLIWSAGGSLAATRLLLLAHWMTDVVVGLVSGVAIERLLWLISRTSRRATQSFSSEPFDVTHKENENGCRSRHQQDLLIERRAER